MYTLILMLSAGICFGALPAASTAIPLTFEQRDTSFLAAGSGNASVRIARDRVTMGGVTLRFVNAADGARLEGLGPAAPATYIGATARRTFQQYPKLAIRNLYPGIDAIFYGSRERLEYDLNLAPRAPANSVRLSFDGARRLRLARDGSLIVEAASGTLQQMPPRVFQAGKAVAAHYLLLPRNLVGFRLGTHDPGLPLTIDPVLVYTKYIGGSASDTANVIASDAQGNVYVAGRSNSPDFPVTAGAAFPGSAPTPPLVTLSDSGKTIAALPIPGEYSVTAIGGTPDGQILYAGASGGAFGTVYYSSNGGATWRKTAPLPVPIFSQIQSAFLVNDISVDAIDPSRAYVATNRGLYSTADNGTSWSPRDYGLAATFDSSINVASVTVSPADHTLLYATTTRPTYLYKSTDAAGTWQILNPAYPGEPPASIFPTSQTVVTLAPNGRDLFVVDGNSVLLKSTDGGVTWQRLTDGRFDARSIVVDPSNPSNVFVRDSTGIQRSTDGGFTLTNVTPPGVRGNDISALALDGSSGALYFSYSGGINMSTDRGATWQTVPLTVDNSVHTIRPIGGRVFVGLETPQTPFLLKLDPTGSRLLYSTFFNGKVIDTVTGLSVDSQGNAYLSGYSFTPNTDGAIKLSNPSPSNFLTSFIAKVTADGTNLAWQAVLGGSKGVFLQALAIDAAGAAYITGQTSSTDFPTTSNAPQAAPPTAPCTRPQDVQLIRTPNLGGWAFASKISPDGKSLVYSTFLTGSCGSVGQGIAVNAAGEAVVGGYTTSPDMPVSPGAYQGAFPGSPDKTSFPNAFNAGFVVRISAAGDKVLAGSYIGGGYDTRVAALAIDRAGNPVITGSTWGITPGPTAGAYQTKIAFTCSSTPRIFGPPIPPSEGADVFVLKLDAALSQASSLTYLGGGCFDEGRSIALDPSGNTWISGITISQDFPLNAPLQGRGANSGFISELSGDGTRLLFSSNSEGTALAIDPSGFVYLAGSTFQAPVAKRTTPSSTAFVNKIDPGATRPVAINSIVNLSYASPATSPFNSIGAVAPGELIRIEGNKLGPAAKVDAQLDSSGRLPFALAGTRVLFDGQTAALISVQESAIVCFVPFAVSQAADVSVEANGQSSNPVRVSVFASVPQILAVVNQDGTANSALNPAPVGSVVVLYVAGLGQTNPASVDGKVNLPPLGVPVAPVNVFILGQSTPPQYVASAMGLIAGITQVNVRVPVLGFSSTTVNISVNSADAPLFISR